jgi:hypothetical protein
MFRTNLCRSNDLLYGRAHSTGKIKSEVKIGTDFH